MRWSFLIAFICLSTAAIAAPKEETAIFAGGCFWSTESAFDEVPGVVSAVSGYTGGTVANPSYHQVSGGDTGHVEAVKVTYDPAKISYDELLDIYWHSIDPFENRGQFCDFGPQYRPGIYTNDKAQVKAAQNSKAVVAKQLGKDVATQISPATTFYPAEDYHQDYKRKNPEAYNRYRIGCGRDTAKAQIWGK